MSFEEIYETYGSRILNLAFRFTGDEEIARDLTQDVFVKVYQNLSDFKHKSGIYTWIYRIATNHFINHLKKERRRRWYQLLDQNIGEIVQADTDINELWGQMVIPSPEHHLEQKEKENLVLRLVHSLPLKYRIPLILQRYEDMTSVEIAEILSLPVATVETRLYRAKKLLVKKLKPWLKYLQ
jgi:RNA polymerase sigma-70 factor (ECF subfamily)